MYAGRAVVGMPDHRLIKKEDFWSKQILLSKCRSGRAQHAAPNKKGNVGRRKTGGAGRQSVVPAARLGTVVG